MNKNQKMFAFSVIKLQYLIAYDVRLIAVEKPIESCF